MRRLTRRQRTAAIVLAVLALVFMTLDLGGGGLQSAHSGVRGSLGALYRGTDGLVGPVRRFVQGLPSAGSSQARVRRLEHENAELRGQLAAGAEDRTSARELTTLRLVAAQRGVRIVPARVVALGAGSGFDWTVTLDAGSDSGVRVGQTVTDGDGLVGRVLHVDRSSCVVILGADPGSGVGSRDLRNGEVGIANGRGARGFTFVPLDPEADIRVGDKLVTGPAGSTSFVAGLAVGTVSSVRRSADGTTRAELAPATAATRLDIVGVILVGGEPVSPRPAIDSSGPVAQR